MLASTFPDDARTTTYGAGNKKKWHYINYAFSPDNTPLPAVPTPNAETKLTSLIAGLKTMPDGQERALDICWLFHLLEDIHQPLHTIALFDVGHPAGDKGGNETYIKVGETGGKVKLHSFWDKLPKGTFDNIPAKADALLKNAKYKETGLTELTTHTTLHGWIVNESVKLAKVDAYKNGTITGTEAAPTVVDVAYKTNAAKIAERRVVLAGIRLAKELVRIYG